MIWSSQIVTGDPGFGSPSVSAVNNPLLCPNSSAIAISLVYQADGRRRREDE